MFGRLIKIACLFPKLVLAYIFLLLKNKDPKKCLVYASFLKSGGTRTYFFSLIEFLSRKKIGITVVLSREQCDAEILELQSQFPFTIREINFQPHRATFTGTIFYKKKQEEIIYQIKELIFFWNCLRKYKCSWCIVSEGHPEVLLLLFLSPVRVIYTLHTVATDRLDKFKRKVLNHCLSASKQIIAVSNYAKKIIIENWISEPKSDCVKVIHNYYEAADHSPILQKKKIKNILTIGTVTWYKNPLFWIEVAKQIQIRSNDNIEFIWAGDGDLLEECKAGINGFSNIKFIGYTKDVAQLYHDCDIYFQPSVLESHGIAVLGAMYFQKPCVVSDRQGLPESVENNLTGLVVPVIEPADSVNAILSLLNHPDKAVQFGKAAKEKAINDFSKSKWYEKMEFIFN